MRRELLSAGVSNTADMTEADLVWHYNITFLANNYQHKLESADYRHSGARFDSGPYKGKFPYSVKENKN